MGRFVKAMSVNPHPPCAGVNTPEDIVRDVRHLPSSAKVLPRLKQLLCDGNSSIHEIVALVRFEPGIAARVLQVANSAYFGLGGRCASVDEAVGRVGFEQVYELVSFAAAAQVLVRPLQVYGIEAEDLWKMSVAGAFAAELLANRTGQDPEVAYTVGLLHCVGMVAFDEWALRHARSLHFSIGSFPGEAIDQERRYFGFTQADTGGVLLRHWGFPASIVEPVRRQYAPNATVSHSRMATLLYVAKWLRNSVCGRTPPPLKIDRLQPIALAREDLATMVDVVAKRLNEVGTLLEKAATAMPQARQIPAGTWKT